ETLQLRARQDSRRGRRGGRADARRQVHRRRHQPARPDEARDRDADAPRRRAGLEARPDRAHRGGRAARRRAGDEHRPRRRRAGAPRLRRARARDPRGRLGPAPEQGDHGGQPAAAHPLPLLLRHGDAVQQARARVRLLGDRRLHPPARGRRIERRVRRHEPQRHGGRDARARREGRDGAAERVDARPPDRRLSPAAGAHAARRDEPETGGAHHRGDAAEAARRHAALPQGARPRVLRIRAGLGRGRRPARRERARRGGRGRPQAVARRGGRGADAARRPRRGRAAARRRAADPRQRVQAPAGRAHARRGPGRGERV
ncbi:MAG: Periplasmic aromatic aldehyde oxidoreductase, FAD binding subunit YagS, partial [uncultured Gemmatimonadaceae bacterium]